MEASATKTILDAITASFFQVFTNKDGVKPNVNLIHELFIPSGIIIRNTDSTPEVYTLQQFIEPREKLLNDGSLIDFEEKELSERTEIFGQIAHRFSLYEKSGMRQGVYFHSKGMKSIQFIHTQDGWKINSLTWDDEK
ncbi:hypothetical protein [Paenibacillus sp. KN14-4R]|uniref:hypothetical protein n=1 Tax=Paenibacillus sp. KN14-4R TaxID=3445773 RepID=UPI003F9FB7F4